MIEIGKKIDCTIPSVWKCSSDMIPRAKFLTTLPRYIEHPHAGTCRHIPDPDGACR